MRDAMMRKKTVRIVWVFAIALTAMPVAGWAQIQVPQVPQIPSQNALNTPTTPVITQPKAGVFVTSPIVVKGTTSPQAKVTVTATLQVPVQVTSVVQKLAEQTTDADAKGNWQVSLSYQILVKVANPQIIIEAVAKNSVTGAKSQSAKLAVKPR